MNFTLFLIENGTDTVVFDGKCKKADILAAAASLKSAKPAARVLVTQGKDLGKFVCEL